MNRTSLLRTITQLSTQRALFHSEADFQHALALELGTTDPESALRLEYRPFPEESIYVDVWLRSQDEVVAMELKYLTKALETSWGHERFALKNQGAHDIIAYDCFKDLERLERFTTDAKADRGFLIVLTNDALYWKTPARIGAGYDAFRLFDGRRVSGILEWGDGAGPGTRRRREDPIHLRGQYRFDWVDYSRPSLNRAGEFKVLVVEVLRTSTSPE